MVNNDKNDMVSVEVEFEDDVAYKLERLVEEGYAQTKGQLVVDAIDVLQENQFEGISTDPAIEQRSREIGAIHTSFDDPAVIDFMTETSYLVQMFERLAHDNDDDRIYDIQSYLENMGDLVEDAPDYEEESTKNFLEYTESFIGIFRDETDDRHYHDRTTNYFERFFLEESRDNMYQKLL